MEVTEQERRLAVKPDAWHFAAGTPNSVAVGAGGSKEVVGDWLEELTPPRTDGDAAGGDGQLEHLLIKSPLQLSGDSRGP